MRTLTILKDKKSKKKIFMIDEDFLKYLRKRLMYLEEIYKVKYD